MHCFASSVISTSCNAAVPNLLQTPNIICIGNYAGLIMAATKQLGTNSNNSNGYAGASE
jgi:hypothetical protein